MKDSFILFSEYSEQFNMLSNEQAGILIKAIFAYSTDSSTDSELPEMDALTKLAFSFIRSALDRSDDKYQRKVEANRENGKLGGRPRKIPQNGAETTENSEVTEEKNPTQNPAKTQKKPKITQPKPKNPTVFLKTLLNVYLNVIVNMI